MLKKKNLTILLIASAWLLASARFFYLIYKYSVNLLYYDEISILYSFLIERSWWKLFTWQHGEHLQGLGFLVKKIILELASYNSKTEAYILGIILSIAAILAIFVKKRITGKYTWSDAIIPFIILTPAQWELFVGAVNTAPQAIPLLLIFAYCLTLFVKNLKIKYTLIAILGFCLLFTGYGFLAGFLVLAITIYELFLALKQKNKKKVYTIAIALLAMIISFVSFFTYWEIDQGNSIPYEELKIQEIPLFISAIFANFLQIKNGAFASYVIGFFLAGIVSLTFFINLYKLLKIAKHSKNKALKTNKKAAEIMTLLSGFTLIYVASCTYGRIGIGLATAQNARYITLLAPGIISIYLFIITYIKKPYFRKIFLYLFIITMLTVTIPISSSNLYGIKKMYQEKVLWKDIYLQNENIQLTNEKSDIKIYPENPKTKMKKGENMQDVFHYLKQHNLNLYIDK